MPRGEPWPEWKLAPCGTTAAYRRHLRRGEKACPACVEAARVAQNTVPSGRVPDHREVRNGLPELRPYVYRGTGRDIYEEADA